MGGRKPNFIVYQREYLGPNRRYRRAARGWTKWRKVKRCEYRSEADELLAVVAESTRYQRRIVYRGEELDRAGVAKPHSSSGPGLMPLIRHQPGPGQRQIASTSDDRRRRHEPGREDAAE